MGERYTGQGEPQMHETNSPLQRLDVVKGLKNLGWALNDVGIMSLQEEIGRG